MTTPAQTKAIHSLRRQIVGMDDDAYRGLLKTKFRVTSSRDLSDAQAITLIDDLKKRSGGGSRPLSQTATGKYAPVLKALWLTGFNLGLVRSREDKALLAFVERQTRLSHTQFLTDPAAAKRAIEALKNWMVRDGGVHWPVQGLDSIETKREVIRAIGTRMIKVGAFEPFMKDGVYRESDVENYGYSRTGADRLPAGFNHYEPHHYDTLAQMMGARLRAHLAKQAEAKGAS